MQRYVTTRRPAVATLVRVLSGDGPDYDRMIVVSPEDGGRMLHLQGWIGRPLTPAQWRAAAASLFPAARAVRFERRDAGGRERSVSIALTRD